MAPKVDLDGVAEDLLRQLTPGGTSVEEKFTKLNNVMAVKQYMHLLSQAKQIGVLEDASCLYFDNEAVDQLRASHMVRIAEIVSRVRYLCAVGW